MAQYLPYILLAVLIVGFAIQLGRIFSGYQLATGTPWQRFLAAFSHSHTILLSRLGAFLAGAAAWIVNFLPLIDPTTEVGMAVKNLLDPKYAVWYGLAYMLIMEWARRRNSSIDPVLPPPQAVVVPPPPIVVSAS